MGSVNGTLNGFTIERNVYMDCRGHSDVRVAMLVSSDTCVAVVVVRRGAGDV